MAKSNNNLQSPITGKLDGATYYMRNGKMVIRRSKNDRPNPTKSVAQASSRMKWNNVQRLWSTFPKEWKPIFQNRKAGSSNYNAFMSENMHTTPIYFTRQEQQSFATVLVPLQVSQGILPEVAAEFNGQELVSSITVGNLSVNDNTTLGQLAKAIVKHNRDFCQGDTLTFVVGEQMEEDGMPKVYFRTFDLTLDTNSEMPLSQAVEGKRGFDIVNGCIACGITTGAATWVHSRQNQGGETIVSSQSLWCENADTIAKYSTEEALTRAQQSYGGIQA